MAQISSDSEAFGESMRSVDDAMKQIAATIAPIPDIESVPLASADGRVLVQDLVATVALPPFTNSAVDGYAVRFADVAAAGGAPIGIADRVMAGGAAKGSAPPGRPCATSPERRCWKERTVFMQEDVRLDHAGRVHFPEGLRCGANVRPVGEDGAVGQVVLPKGRRLRPQDVAARAQFIRTLLLEVERLHGNLLNIGLACHFVGFNTGFMRFFRVREKAMAMADLLTGARKTYAINLTGGVRRDVLKRERVRTFRPGRAVADS
jgi:molybdopterin molybdotransferase